MNNESVMKRELSEGKMVLSFTKGDSMEPLLYDSSTCVLIAPARENLQENDLPLYQRPNGQLVMHRIIKIDEEYYYTRGDNRDGLEKVPKNWTIGVATEIQRNGEIIKVTDKGYLFYVRFWNFIYPIRRIFYVLRRRCRRAQE